MCVFVMTLKMGSSWQIVELMLSSTAPVSDPETSSLTLSSSQAEDRSLRWGLVDKSQSDFTWSCSDLVFYINR